jgi:hypothetical protein
VSRGAAIDLPGNQTQSEIASAVAARGEAAPLREGSAVSIRPRLQTSRFGEGLVLDRMFA